MDKLASSLAAVDFSACSRTALAQAQRIAAWNSAKLRVVHVAEPMTLLPADPMFGLPSMADVAGDPVRDARAAWAEFAAGIPGGESVACDVVMGSPASEIPLRAKDGRHDLIVMGTFGTGQADRGIGTTAAAVVRRAGTKVLLVRHDQHAAFKRLVACVDFSETSMRALEASVRLAAQDSAALHILHVFDPPWKKGIVAPTSPMASVEFRERYRGAIVKHMHLFAEPFKHELAYLKPSFDLFEHDSHGRGAALFASTVGADLVVLGTRGKSSLRDLVIGSTAERILRHVHCSALTIPPA